jgi:4-amino-4-deoxy-L-arabinose transferase-like glycosyltransferase
VSALASLDLGVRIFANNDEARFPVLAAGLLRGGSWFPPALNGTAYLAKPPLLAWLIAACSWPGHHVTQFTAVLPSAVAGIVTVLLVHRIGVELFGRRAALCAALVAATTQGLFLHQRLPMPDMLLVALQTASVWMLVRLRAVPGGRAWIGFYAFVAGAFWAKGLAGLLPLGVALAYAGLTRQRRGARWLRLGKGCALLAVLTAAWWIAGLRVGASELRQAIVIDQLFWYLPQRPTVLAITTPFQHLVGILFPWVLVLPWAALAARRPASETESERGALLFLSTWCIAAFALIAPSNEQRLRYYLPLVAPCALLIGWWLTSAAAKRRQMPSLGWLTYAAGALLLASAGVFATVVRTGGLGPDARLSVPASLPEMLLLIAAGAVFLASLLWMARYRTERAVFVAAAAAAVLVAGLYHGDVARRNIAYDFPGAAPRLASTFGWAGAMASWDVPDLPLAFYLDRPVLSIKRREDLFAVRTSERPVGIVARPAASVRISHFPGAALLGQERIGTQPVLVASYQRPSTLPPSGGKDLGSTSPGMPPIVEETLLGTEVASVLLALFGCALRHGASSPGDQGRLRVGSIIAIGGLALFPRNWAVLAIGAALAAWLASARLVRSWPSTPACLGLIMLLPLPLDAVEDLLDGHRVSADGLWIATTALGVALGLVLLWRHRMARDAIRT